MVCVVNTEPGHHSSAIFRLPTSAKILPKNSSPLLLDLVLASPPHPSHYITTHYYTIQEKMHQATKNATNHLD